jgi:hypothetical protein
VVQQPYAKLPDLQPPPLLPVAAKANREVLAQRATSLFNRMQQERIQAGDFDKNICPWIIYFVPISDGTRSKAMDTEKKTILVHDTTPESAIRYLKNYGHQVIIAKPRTGNGNNALEDRQQRQRTQARSEIKQAAVLEEAKFDEKELPWIIHFQASSQAPDSDKKSILVMNATPKTVEASLKKQGHQVIRAHVDKSLRTSRSPQSDGAESPQRHDVIEPGEAKWLVLTVKSDTPPDIRRGLEKKGFTLLIADAPKSDAPPKSAQPLEKEGSASSTPKAT